MQIQRFALAVSISTSFAAWKLRYHKTKTALDLRTVYQLHVAPLISEHSTSYLNFGGRVFSLSATSLR
jgi:hypothetical protein